MLLDNRIKAVIELARKAFGKYFFQIVILTILGFFSGLLEGVGVNAVIPLFSLMMRENSGANDIISRTIGEVFNFLDINLSLKTLLIFISLLFIFKAGALILSGYISAKICADYEEQNRRNLFNKILKTNWPFLLKQKIGHLENTLMVDIEFSANLLRGISATIMILTSLIMYILVAINISVYITLFTIGLGAVLFLLLKPLIYKTRSIAHEVNKTNKKITHHINESIIGIKTIKAMFAENIVARIASEYFNKLKRLKVKIFLLKNITGSLLQPISLIFICVVFAFSYKMPGFHLAALVAVIYLIQKIFEFIQQLQNNLHGMYEAIPYLKNVLTHEDNAYLNKEENYGSIEFKLEKNLEFRNVFFNYQQDKGILSGINFSIKKGEMVGLIGPSGAGKTTIVDLILRLFEPDQGAIFLDDINIRDIEMSKWRKNIGYVPQDLFLINDTVTNNIRYYDDSINDQDIAEAAQMANICEFIQQCPQGFETVIGERGVMLSTGQRQRIVIARVLARRPQIIILDEATSALDNESEMQIQKVIENLRGNVTIIVIAHRLSTVINCDKLVVLEKGKIIEQGIPSELLKDNGSYFFKVYNTSFANGREETI